MGEEQESTVSKGGKHTGNEAYLVEVEGGVDK